MVAMRCAMVAGVVLLLSAAAAAQPLPDCGNARTPVDKLICSNPGLAAADAAMAQAYAALAKGISPPQKAALLADQRRWIGQRAPGCQDKQDDALVSCLLAETQARRRFLAGEGPNGATGAPALLPEFLAETKKGVYEISVEYPQFAAPHDAKFNQAVRDLTIAPKTLAQYRQADPQRVPGTSNFYDVGYTIDYLSPSLGAVTFGFNDFQGGAHPNNWRSAILWNPVADTPVTLGDILAEPAKAVPAIAAVCRDKLAVEAKAEDWDFFPDADFAGVVKDAKSWSVDRDGATIMFDPYSVAAYVVGPRDCRLTYAELAQWLKPGGALPPK